MLHLANFDLVKFIKIMFWVFWISYNGFFLPMRYKEVWLYIKKWGYLYIFFKYNYCIAIWVISESNFFFKVFEISCRSFSFTVLWRNSCKTGTMWLLNVNWSHLGPVFSSRKKKTIIAFEFTNFLVYWHEIVYCILIPF